MTGKTTINRIHSSFTPVVAPLRKTVIMAQMSRAG
jgi:hypothetical protein